MSHSSVGNQPEVLGPVHCLLDWHVFVLGWLIFWLNFALCREDVWHWVPLSSALLSNNIWTKAVSSRFVQGKLGTICTVIKQSKESTTPGLWKCSCKKTGEEKVQNIQAAKKHWIFNNHFEFESGNKTRPVTDPKVQVANSNQQRSKYDVM